jgi:hypothetical protein
MIAFPSWISEFVVSSLQQLLSGNGSSFPPLTLKTYYNLWKHHIHMWLFFKADRSSSLEECTWTLGKKLYLAKETASKDQFKPAFLVLKKTTYTTFLRTNRRFHKYHVPDVLPKLNKLLPLYYSNYIYYLQLYLSCLKLILNHLHTNTKSKPNIICHSLWSFVYYWVIMLQSLSRTKWFLIQISIIHNIHYKNVKIRNLPNFVSIIGMAFIQISIIHT